MANTIENEASFEAFLDRLADGLSIEDKIAANKAGADVFKQALHDATPRSDTVYKRGTVHLQDAIVEEVSPSGRVEVGFSAKSQRGHIARFQNDGLTATVNDISKCQANTSGKKQSMPLRDESKKQLNTR